MALPFATELKSHLSIWWFTATGHARTLSEVLELWSMCSSAKPTVCCWPNLLSVPFSSFSQHLGATGNIDSEWTFMLRYQGSTAGYPLENIKPPHWLLLKPFQSENSCKKKTKLWNNCDKKQSITASSLASTLNNSIAVIIALNLIWQNRFIKILLLLSLSISLMSVSSARTGGWTSDFVVLNASALWNTRQTLWLLANMHFVGLGRTLVQIRCHHSIFFFFF